VGEMVRADQGVAERGGRSSFAGDLGCNPLIDLRRDVRVDEDGEVGLAEHVDKTRSDHAAARVNAALCGGMREAANCGDAAVANADVAGIPGRAGGGDDVGGENDEV